MNKSSNSYGLMYQQQVPVSRLSGTDIELFEFSGAFAAISCAGHSATSHDIARLFDNALRLYKLFYTTGKYLGADCINALFDAFLNAFRSELSVSNPRNDYGYLKSSDCFIPSKESFMWNPDDMELPDKTTAEMGLYVIDDATSYVVYTSTGEQLEFDTFNGAEAFCVENIQGGVEWITDNEQPKSKIF